MQFSKTFYLSFTIILFFLLMNILLGLQVDLSADAAHYALYGQHLDWSYFDHPPLVGWLQALILYFGDANYLLRIWSWFFGLATVSVLYFIAARFFENQHRYLPLVCVLFFYNAIILNLLGFDLLPQTPLLLFALLSVYSVYKISINPSWGHWLCLGVLIGIGGLADYIVAPLALGIFIYFILFDRIQLSSIKPYLAACLSLFCLIPVIYWNAQHDWISFRYQLDHGFSSTHWKASLFFQSIGTQLGAYSPALVVFACLGVWKGLRIWKDVGSRILICMALPIIVLFIYSGAYNQILMHWPAIGWLLLIPLAARFVLEHWQKLWVRILVIGNGILTVCLYLLLYMQAFFSLINFPLGYSPFNDLQGWSQAAQEARKVLWTLPPASQNLFVSNWSLAGRLAWYSHLPVQVTDSPKFKNQFTLWYGKPAAGSSGLLIVPVNWRGPLGQSTLSHQFAECHFIKQLSIQMHDKPFSSFDFYYCKNFIL